MEYLPGQYDQLLTPSHAYRRNSPSSSARVYVLEGEPTEQNVEAVKRYVSNPVDGPVIPWMKYRTLAVNTTCRKTVDTVKARRHDRGGLRAFTGDQRPCHGHRRSGCCWNISAPRRDPNGITEIKVIDNLLVRSCRHTTFNTVIDSVESPTRR